MARVIDETKLEKKNQKLDEILKELKESFNRKDENIYEKLNTLRMSFLACNPSKTGLNEFKNVSFKYFTLEDIVPITEPLCSALGLCTYPSVHIEGEKQFAVMQLVNVDKPEESLGFQIELCGSNVSGANQMQNMGASKSYARRYLWLDVLDAAEYDDYFDATSGLKNTDIENKPRTTRTNTSATASNPPRQAQKDERPAGKIEPTKKTIGKTVYDAVVKYFGWSKDLSEAEKKDVISESKEFLRITYNVTDLDQITPELADEIMAYIKRTA